MKNLYLLPTDKPTRLILQGSELVLSKYMEVNEGFSEFNQHIYITSDEKIKEGDWYYLPKENKVAKCPKILKLSSVTPEWTQKIILTTDQDLFKDGVQAIDDEFLEWFVKNPSCEEINIKQSWEFLGYDYRHGGQTLVYKIIIPKEEPKQGYICPQTKQQCDDECCVSSEDFHIISSLSTDVVDCDLPKQETLEEAAEHNWLYNEYGFETGYNPQRCVHGAIQKPKFISGFKKGAKWQAERMYSEEEMQNAFVSGALTDLFNTWNISSEDMAIEKFKEWFEQFKKNN